MEDRYDTIGDLAAGHTNTLMSGETVIGNAGFLSDEVNDIVFVVYTERVQTNDNGKREDVTRLISPRLATDFERGCIMVNADKMTAEIIEELAFSEEDLALLAKARNTPISFDEDCPETVAISEIIFKNEDVLPKFKFRKQMIDEFKNVLMLENAPLIN